MNISGPNTKYWMFWLVLTVGIAVFLSTRLSAEDKTIYLPGPTSHGHYQIELACQACHTDPFGGAEVLQAACVQCHGAELAQANDSHPKSKFTDPRNASRVAKLDARLCVTCHTEHRPEITRTMGVTVAADVCFDCHSDIAEDRPSHAGMGFSTCASAGCHNFHDNRGIYEDFLLKHVNEPDISSHAQVPQRHLRSVLAALDGYPIKRYPMQVLSGHQADRPAGLPLDGKIEQEWLSTAHAKAGVNCSACHASGGAWTSKPDHQACRTCHDQEVGGFLAGKHGMRLAQGLSPMSPGMAHLPMHSDAASHGLGCGSCHNAHRFDTRSAAVAACLGCHDDEHTRAYKSSAHYMLWQKEMDGLAAAGSGVSCATCHLPRTLHRQAGGQHTRVMHNQNDNLRPNSKMLRPVCQQCHGLAFSMDALADAQLVRNNFRGRPLLHVDSMDMAVRRAAEKPAKANK